MRVAAIDCGTNSLRLLVADVEEGRVHDVVRRTEITRLGEGVDRRGILSPAALARTRQVLRSYAAAVRAAGAARTRVVATSATRDAANRAEFVSDVRELVGVEPEVVSGLREAELSFTGAVSGLPGPSFPVLVADIGGGSTELVLGSPGSALHAHSMDIGSVRLTERHIRDDPPTSEQIGAVEADVASALASAGVPVRQAATVVGVAGTVVTVAAISQGVQVEELARLHATALDRREIARVSRMLLSLTHAERLALSGLHPGRADVIAAGALVLRAIVDAADADQVVVSTHDLLDGIALSLV